MKKNKNGFTLTEVLITLSILGVVAAISIPNMIQNYKKRVTVTKIQKAYAQINQMASNIAINSGCMGQTVQCSGLLDFNDTANNQNFAKKFIELSGLKAKIIGTNRADVYPMYCENVADKCANNHDINVYTRIQTDDGLIYTLRNTVSSRDVITDKGALSIGVITEKNKRWVAGKNAFFFIIYNNFIVEPVMTGYTSKGAGAIPMSKTTSGAIDYYCNPKDTGSVSPKYGSGTSCAAKIIKDGWKITY